MQTTPRRRLLRLGATLLFVATAALWMGSPSGPPRPLVALFDGDWQADRPFLSSETLEIRAPHSLGYERLLDLEHKLGAAVQRTADVLVRDEMGVRLFWIVPREGVPHARIEAVVASSRTTLALLPVLDEGTTANAIRAFVLDRGDTQLKAETSPLIASTEAELIGALEVMRDLCESCRPKHGEGLVIEYDGQAWSALVVSYREPVFDQTMLASAEVGVNSYDNHPVVKVFFTEEGQRAFRELSRELVGSRLAIVVDGKVVSSPRVMVEIDSNQIEINVGNGSETELMKEAGRIANALTPGISLPPETTWSWRTLEGAATSALVLSAVLALMLAGLLGFGGAIAIERFERWAAIDGPPSPDMKHGRDPLSPVFLLTRVGATLLALAAPYLVTQIPIPILDPDVLAELGDSASAFSSIGVAGLTPLIFAFLLSSLIVWLVPPLSRLRSGSFDARRRMLLPTGLIAFALCTLQAVAMTPLLTGVELLEPGVLSSILVALSLTAGTFLLWGAAALATLVGFGQGFSLLIAGSILFAIVEQPAMVADGRTLAIVLLIGVVLSYATSRRLNRPEGQRRLPLPGLTPIELLGLIQALLMLISLLVNDDLRSPQLGLWLSLVVFVVLTAGLSWVMNRTLGKAALLRGLVPTVLTILLVVHGALFVAELGPTIAPMKLAELLGLFLFLPIVLDLGGELAATLRLGRLSRVHSTHSPDEADRLVTLLSERSIPALSRGIRHRTLLRFLAPYLPIEVLVPLSERRAAMAFLREDAIGDIVTPFGEGTSNPLDLRDTRISR